MPRTLASFRIIYFIQILLLCFVQRGVCARTEPIKPSVSTPLGKVEGYVGFTVNLNPFFKFEGVPYAKPPIGELRFEEPQDVEPWIGTWKANVLTRCMQYDHFNQDAEKNYLIHGDEDCLYVNIYTHSTSPKSNLDVLVHIHGGAFMFGAGSSYGPDIIMDRPVVYVNLNYRLGPLGFLSTEDETLPGNLGLRDQIKALQWIKANIKYFGGNPDSITIHGMSAGGASIHFHYFLPASKGLFNKGISQSGSVLNPWVLMENAKEKAIKVAGAVGCPTTGGSQEIKKCLKSRAARSILRTISEFQPFLYNPFSPFGAVVDGRWSKNPLLPDHPYDLLKRGEVQDLPWMISYTSHEGLYPASEFWADDQHYLPEIDSKWNDIIPFILHYNETVDYHLKDEVSQTIRKEYFGDEPLNRETYPKLVELIGDRLFKADIETAAKLHSAASKSNIYSYSFAYRGAKSKSNSRTKSNVNIGVSHGDDTIYVLSAGINTTSTEDDRTISNLFLDMFTSFMQFGVPNITSNWQPLSKSINEPFVQLKILGPKTYELEINEEIGRRSFWESLRFKENRNHNAIQHLEL